MLWFAALAALAQLPTVQLVTGMHAIRAEVANSMESRMQGLMYRKEMPQGAGMVFVFEENAAHCMWMKNTLIPLSVAFIDRDGIILNIEDMEPRTLDTHTAAGPAAFAIEANKGWYAEKKVRPGDKVTGLPKAR